MIRTIDDLGRIVIPKEMRRELNIKDGSRIKIEATTNGILLTKVLDTKEQIKAEIERLNELLEDNNG